MVLGHKSSTDPLPETLSSSLCININEKSLAELKETKQLEASCLKQSDGTFSKNIEDNDCSLFKPKKIKRKCSDSPPQWFLDFVKKQEDEGRWNKFFKIEEKKNTIIRKYSCSCKQERISCIYIVKLINLLHILVIYMKFLYYYKCTTVNICKTYINTVEILI